MSTLAYAALTTRRRDSDPGTSTDTQPPGVKTFIDSLAALVPAEVLVAHAAILSLTTSSSTNQAGEATTTITHAGVLKGTFWSLLVVAIVLYILGRTPSKWDKWDYARVCIPPLAFVGWTLIQSPTAFDAIAPGWSAALRGAVAIIGALVLAAAAVRLGYKADQTKR